MTTNPGPSSSSLQVLAHISGLVTLVGIPSVIGPLVVWLLYRRDPAVEPHARAALNFHLSMLIYALAAVVLLVVLVLTIIGILLVPLLLLLVLGLVIFEIVASVIGAMRASEGRLYRYPLSLQLVR